MKDEVAPRLSGVRLADRAGTWDIAVRDGRIAALSPVEQGGGGMVLPLLADVHVHLDKTFTGHRIEGRPATLFDAIDAMSADRALWTEDDVRARAQRALERAWRSGTGAMRTHVDWSEAEVPLAWPVLCELREEWRGRVHLQLASLSPVELLVEEGAAIAARVARDGGVLGGFVYRNGALEEAVEKVFALADRHDLRLDFHVDEGLEPEAQGFDVIVAETARREMAGRVLCGHACSLAIRPEDEVARVLDAAGEAGVALTVLPTTNAWLQDGTPGRTPRLRGLAPLHEAREAGIEVMIASDNVRDGFYPFGDYDLVEVFRAAVLAAHLDPADWSHAIADMPANWCGMTLPALEEDEPADFLWIDAEDWADLVSCPRARRVVWRDGAPIEVGERAAGDAG